MDVQGKIVHHHFESLDSTNTWAKVHAHELNPTALTVVSASEQTAGRGRFNRTWESPSKLNLYVTFCFFIDINRSDLGHIPQVLAVSVCDLLEERQFHPVIKWPNDLLLSGKKVAGILCETSTLSNHRFIACGIGLNVNMPNESLKLINQPATSLFVEGGRLYALDSLLEALKQKFFSHLQLFIEKGFSPFFKTFASRFALKQGQFIRFHGHSGLIEGRFVALNLDGSITLEVNHEIKQFYTGEIVNS